MEQGLAAPCFACLWLDFSLIQHVRVDKSNEGGTDERHEQEPKSCHPTEERSNERQSAGDHKQDRTDAVGFIPDLITGKSPWRADTDEKVAFRLTKHVSNKEE